MNSVATVTADPAIGVIADICVRAEKSGEALAAQSSHPTARPTPTNAVIENILSSSAAKYYDPAATLSDDQIRGLVRIGTAAPTSFHLQNWRFIAVRTPEAKARLRPLAWDAFTNVPSNGKIAMRFEDDSPDRLIGVALLTENDDVLLATRQGKAIRFEATVVREFQSRTSTGVRGIDRKSVG